MVCRFGERDAVTASIAESTASHWSRAPSQNITRQQTTESRVTD